ncbi:AAA family ATPase [Flagellimonas aurea]|uniref:ATP-binding protein n=1 Tax=Flagellimonas aurea TaxID=2915619 RepID=UPI0035CF7829
MIEYYHNRGKEIPLVIKRNLIPEKNVFSILVGKNGTGKSTLLGNLAIEFRKELSRIKHRNNEFLFDDDINYNLFPFEIISVSTSPFDKFPLDRFNRQKFYTYLGLRDINSSSIGLGYLSKIIGSLIESIAKNPKQAFEICNVLEFLQYRDEMSIILEFNLSLNKLQELVHDKNFVKEFDNRSNPVFRRINRQFFTNSDNTINERKLNKLYKLTFDLLENEIFNRRVFGLTINRYGFDEYEIRTEIENVLFLFEAGIIRLKDVLLNTINFNDRFSIKDASSGEQSIILSILGIASRIKDNCLILIDEPEICLHPHWQEKYIEILTNTFDKYRNCQFIIATHSPLIISKLSSYNSFVINLEDGSIDSSESFINNSVDFQLANVFKNPGFKNEYLLRIAVSTFSKVSKYKKFDGRDIENLNRLSAQLNNLKKEDPIYDLTKTLIKLKEMYG